MLYKFPHTRMRRLRQNGIRDLVKENILLVSDLILPIFIKAGIESSLPIDVMPGHYQLSLQDLAPRIREIISVGIKSIMIFGVPLHKDELGSDSYSHNGIMQQAIKIIKDTAPDLLVISDICFCEYTTHGHCGVLDNSSGKLDLNNDQTLELLQQQAVSHAQAGTDLIAPSGMIDGMVGAIRQGLDQAGFEHLPILSYSVKYASAMYGPFRQAAEGAPQIGDRKSYQMDFSQGNEALREVALDLSEGADLLMVKPAHTYLDVIYRIKQKYPEVPLGAYHTSGEFAMIKAASKQGLMDEKQAVMEVLTSIRRAGADFILSYYAEDVCRWLSE